MQGTRGTSLRPPPPLTLPPMFTCITYIYISAKTFTQFLHSAFLVVRSQLDLVD